MKKPYSFVELMIRITDLTYTLQDAKLLPRGEMQIIPFSLGASPHKTFRVCRGPRCHTATIDARTGYLIAFTTSQDVHEGGHAMAAKKSKKKAKKK